MQLRAAAVVLVFSAGVAAFAVSKSAAHIVSGTETLIHVAQPGVEITTYSDALAWRRLTGSGETSPAAMLRLFAEAWTVTGDGAACAVDPLASQAAAAREDNHIRLRVRFNCASVTEAVSIRAALPFGNSAPDIHLYRLILANRMTTGRFEGTDPRIDIPVAKMLRRWKAVLAKDFFTDQPPGDRAD